MEREVEKFPVLQVTEDGGHSIEGVVARELPFTIILNDQELVTLLCSPKDLKYLAVGFLASEGLLTSKDEIKGVMVDEERGVARVEAGGDKGFAQEALFKRLITSGCGRGAAFYSAADIANQKVESQMKMSAEDIFDLVKRFQSGSALYLATHGVHSAALCDSKQILVFNEDIGRHNAIDKIFGKCLLEGISTDERALVTSGRVTSEILHKAVKRNIPIIISISAPTNLGVRIADSLGITLVALVRGRKMNIYTNGWRIVTGGK